MNWSFGPTRLNWLDQSRRSTSGFVMVESQRTIFRRATFPIIQRLRIANFCRRDFSCYIAARFEVVMYLRINFFGYELSVN